MQGKRSYYSLCVTISFGRVWIVCMSTILSRLDATTNTHATIASAHARHAIARAKLKNSDRRVLKSARAPIVKRALDKNITVLKDFDFKTCRQLNEKKKNNGLKKFMKTRVSIFFIFCIIHKNSFLLSVKHMINQQNPSHRCLYV